jgi:hypothetical protein
MISPPVLLSVLENGAAYALRGRLDILSNGKSEVSVCHFD